MRHILLALLSFLLAFSVACAVPLARATPTNVPPTPTPTPVPTATRIPAGTIILGESNPEATLREVQKASSDIWDLAKSPGKRMELVLLNTSGSSQAMSLSFNSKGHLRILQKETGQAATFLIERKNLSPVLKVVDDKGETIIRNGKPLEYSLLTAQNAGYQESPWAEKGIELGVKIVAIALVAWIGLAVAKVIIAGLSTIAFVGIVAGLVVIAAAVTQPFLAWLGEQLGIGEEDIKKFMEKSKEELAVFLQTIIQHLEQQQGTRTI